MYKNVVNAITMTIFLLFKRQNRLDRLFFGSGVPVIFKNILRVFVVKTFISHENSVSYYYNV